MQWKLCYNDCSYTLCTFNLQLSAAKGKKRRRILSGGATGPPKSPRKAFLNKTEKDKSLLLSHQKHHGITYDIKTATKKALSSMLGKSDRSVVNPTAPAFKTQKAVKSFPKAKGSTVVSKPSAVK